MEKMLPCSGVLDIDMVVVAGWDFALSSVVPYWPQLSYCLSFQTRIRAYLVKGKGLLLSKVPRDTAMRHI